MGGRGEGGGNYFGGFGDAFAEDFDFEVAEGGVQLGDWSGVSGRGFVGTAGGDWGPAYCHGHDCILFEGISVVMIDALDGVGGTCSYLSYLR